jgi:hypothetical protein
LSEGHHGATLIASLLLGQGCGLGVIDTRLKDLDSLANDLTLALKFLNGLLRILYCRLRWCGIVIGSTTSKKFLEHLLIIFIYKLLIINFRTNIYLQ